MELNIKGQVTLVGGPGHNGKTQMNWKTGVYFDEEGKRQQLTVSEPKLSGQLYLILIYHQVIDLI